MKRRVKTNMEALHNPDISEGVLRYLTRGLDKRQASKFRAFHVMRSHNIALTPGQKEEEARLKIIAQQSRN
jgi:hypothetical protein